MPATAGPGQQKFITLPNGKVIPIDDKTGGGRAGGLSNRGLRRPSPAEVLSDGQLSSLWNYQHSWNETIQSLLRNPEAPLPGFPGEPPRSNTEAWTRMKEESLRAIQEVSSAIQSFRTVAPMKVFRGADLGEVADPESLVGKTYSDKGFLSTSVSPAVAKTFAEEAERPCIFTIHLPEGHPAISMNEVLSKNNPRIPSSSSGLNFSGDKEVLLDHGGRYRVESVAPQKGFKTSSGEKTTLYHIHLVPLPPDSPETDTFYLR